MEKIFVDTNIFLRFLIKDSEASYSKSFSLFKKASEGKINLLTSTLVIFEIVWTLESFYKVEKSEIVEKVLGILNLPNLEVEKAEILLQALILWKDENIDFADAYNYCFLLGESVDCIYSYDKHFDRLLSIKRLEP